MSISLNTGKQEFVLKFDNGETRSIFFNPCDPDLAWRLKDYQKKVEARTAELSDFALDENGEPTDSAQIETYRAFRNILVEEFDRAFNAKISDAVFEFCSPFADVGDGDLYILHFISAIMPEIEERNATSREKKKAATQKYLNKYGKS